MESEGLWPFVSERETVGKERETLAPLSGAIAPSCRQICRQPVTTARIFAVQAQADLESRHQAVHPPSMPTPDRGTRRNPYALR